MAAHSGLFSVGPIRVVVTVVLAAMPQYAAAKNLELLARVLIPAYMAQNFAAACVVDDPDFVEDTAGPKGHVHIFAKHVKDEVSAGLDKEDVTAMLRVAADTARSIALAEFNAARAGSHSAEPNALHRFCEKSAKPFVREIIVTHFEKHAEIERIIAEAARD